MRTVTATAKTALATANTLAKKTAMTPTARLIPAEKRYATEKTTTATATSITKLQVPQPQSPATAQSRPAATPVHGRVPTVRGGLVAGQSVLFVAMGPAANLLRTVSTALRIAVVKLATNVRITNACRTAPAIIDNVALTAAAKEAADGVQTADMFALHRANAASAAGMARLKMVKTVLLALKMQAAQMANNA